MTEAASQAGCLVCGPAAGTVPFGTKAGYDWRRCRRCGLRYMHRPSDEELRRHYEAYYGPHSPQVPHRVKDSLIKLVRSFEPYRLSGRLLDVGFGEGWLLRAAAGEGWSCWGTEFAADSIRIGAAEGWRVFPGKLPEAGFPSDHFDVVTLVEVLEHLAEPVDYLKEAARVLRPGGLLFGTTPNARSVNARILKLNWSIYSPPEHLQLFTHRALHKAVTSAGFRLIDVGAEGLNPVELRRRDGGGVSPVGRVEAGYALNERITEKSTGRFLKATANRALSWTQLGDTLKFRAVRA